MNEKLHPTKKEFLELIMYSEYLNMYQKNISGASKIRPEKGEKIIELELHLLSCKTCLEMLKDIGYLKNNFDTVWEQEFQLFPISEIVDVDVQPQPFLLKLLSWINNSLKIAKERERAKFVLILEELEAKIINSLNDIQMESNTMTPKLQMATVRPISTPHSDYEHKLENITLYWDKIPFKKENIKLDNGKLTFQYNGSLGFTNAMLINPETEEEYHTVVGNEINGWYTIEFNNVKDELTQTEKEKIKEIEYYLYLYNLL